MWRFNWTIDLSKKLKPRYHMFRVGDKIQYPHHGRGQITGLETYKGRDFYRIQMDSGNMRIMVPIDKMNKVGAVFLKP